MQHTLTLASGQVIRSGSPGPAILSCSYSGSVNDCGWLCPGAVVASEVQLELFDPQGLALAVGEPLELEGLGTFYIQTLRREKQRLAITAQDCLTWLDRDIAHWLPILEENSYTLRQLIVAVCRICGLTWEPETIPNEDLPIEPFRAETVTARQVLKWAAQAAGRFVVAAGPDSVRLDWYRDRGHSLTAQGPDCCYSHTMEAPVAPPTALTIRRSEADLGITAGEGTDALTLTGNYLLLQPTQATAQAILQELQLPCVPCVVETPVDIRPGEVFTLLGQQTLAMSVTRTGGRSRITCQAQPPQVSRFSSQYQALGGRTMELELKLEGLRAQVSQVQGQAEQSAALALDVQGITGRVTAVEEQAQALHTQSTALTQRSDSLELSLHQQTQALDTKAEAADLTEFAKHFRFDADGLTIWSGGTGMGIGVSEERVVFTGGEDPATVIYPASMETEHLAARRLSLGAFSLFPRTNGNLSLRYTGSG